MTKVQFDLRALNKLLQTKLTRDEMQWSTREDAEEIATDTGITGEGRSQSCTAIQLAPRDPLTYMGRANFYDRMNDIDKALVNYGAAALLDRCNPIIYFNRAIALHTHTAETNWQSKIWEHWFYSRQALRPMNTAGYLFLRTDGQSTRSGLTILG